MDGSASQEAQKGQTNRSWINKTLHTTIYQVDNWKRGKDEAAYSAAANNALKVN